jgi:cytochrome c-type biogenesis protein CcmH/NrfG
MADKPNISDDVVKKSTMLAVACVALGIGFLGGVVFSAFKAGTGMPVPGPQTPPQQTAQKPSITEDQARQIRDLERKVAANPDDESSWIRMGNLYFDTSNFKSAIRAYEKALSLNPKNDNVQTDLGVMYRRSGQPEKAIEAFEKAVEINPKQEIARFNKGIVMLHDLNDPKGALEAWEGLIAVNPAAMTPGGQPVTELVKRLKETTASR